MRRVLGRAERRREILEAAAAVFARKGYRQTAISDIIEAAGIARGTFYHHFKSKEELFLALIDAFFTGLHAIASTRGEPEWVEPVGVAAAGRMARDLRQWLQYLRANRALAHVVLREGNAIDARFEERMDQFVCLLNSSRAERIRAMQAGGFYRSDLDVDLINACLNGMVHEVVLRYVLPGEEPDLEKLIGDLVELALHGLAAPKIRGRGRLPARTSEEG